MTEKKVTFLSRHRKAQVTPNPDHPNGVDIDTGTRPACKVDLPYPAECVGLWYVECECKANAIITAAGRPDDPKSYMLPCRPIGTML